MNSFTVVGRVCRMPEIRNDRGWKSVSITLETERPFANNKGEFESDEIEIVVYRGAAEMIQSCAKLNTWLCVKGRIQSRAVSKDGRTWLNYTLIAEKVEYLI